MLHSAGPADLNMLTPVTPSVSPDVADALVAFVIPSMLAVYKGPERIKIMFADPRDPANPERRQSLNLTREQAKRLADVLREASLTI